MTPEGAGQGRLPGTGCRGRVVLATAWGRAPSRVIAGILLVLLFVSGCQRPAAVPDGGSPAVSGRGPGMRQQIDDIPLDGPRTFDLDHVSAASYGAALGDAPDQIFEFVRDRIAYEAYPGVLRGSRGTLLALAGNSADRALLLAELLRRGGHRVRFARGTLADPIARELVTTMFAERPRPSPASGQQPPAPGPADGLMDSIRRDYAVITSRLKDIRAPAGRPDRSVDALVTEARAHVWVQWDKDGQWVDLDPLFSDAAPGRTYTKADSVDDALPDALFHRVTVRVRVEEFSEGALRDRQVLSFATTAAELSGRDLLLLHQPEHWRGPVTDLGGALSAGIEETGRIRPVFLTPAKTVVVGEPFTARDAGGIGRVGTLLRGTPQGLPATAEFVDFEFSAPDGGRRVVQREVFDVVGKALRASAQQPSEEEIRGRLESSARSDLRLSAYDIFFTTGRLHISHLLNLREEPRSAGGRGFDLRAALRRMSIMTAAVIDGVAGRFGSPGRAIIVLYPDAPRVYIAEFRSDGKSRSVSLDLRSDRVRAAALGSAQDDVRLVRILRGVIGGSVEHAVLEYLTAAARAKGILGAVISTSLITAGARRERVATVLLPGQSGRLDPTVPQDDVARIREQTGSGRVAVAPERPIDIDGRRRFAWWLVDPSSGETIPVTDEGLHQAATENEFVVVKTEDSAGEAAYYVASREGSMVFLEGPIFSADKLGLEVTRMLSQGFVRVANAPWLPLVWP